MTENSLDGLDLQIGGTQIDMNPVVLTEEVFNEAFERIKAASNRPYCQDEKGVFHHWPFPFLPKVCQLCGWSLND